MHVIENRPKPWVPYLILGPLVIPILILFTWLFLSSFSVSMYGLVPEQLTLKNWSILWSTPPNQASIWAYFMNTFLFASIVTIIEVFIASSAAYAISRLNFPGRRFLLSFVIILHAFPSITLIVAIFFVLRTLGLYDTLSGIILIKVAFELPFAIWVMKGFFDDIPWDIEIAALVDGASRFHIWRKIMLPIVGPGIAAISIFTFLTAWSEFMIPYIFAPTSSYKTLSVLLNELMSQAEQADYGLVATVGVFYILPVIIFYAFTQKYLVHIFSGGVKG